MNRRVALPLTLAACLLAVACSDDPDLSGTSSSARPSASAAASASATGTPSAAADAPFEANTARDEQEASGGPLSVTSVRVGRHDGYDRVVFELDGREPGVPGWQVEYVDDPRRDGSGDPVEVAGDKTLVVLIRGTGYPFDTGVEEAEEARVPGDVKVVEDVVLGSVFEGVYEAFIGTSHEAPFRVFRLADPARVVVDIRHE
jgi:hypothetical protein